MLLKEIRKDVVDKEGRTHSKLVCIVLVEEDSIAISIKNRDLEDAVLLDLTSFMKSCVDENMISDVDAICKSVYQKLK